MCSEMLLLLPLLLLLMLPLLVVVVTLLLHNTRNKRRRKNKYPVSNILKNMGKTLFSSLLQLANHPMSDPFVVKDSSVGVGGGVGLAGVDVEVWRAAAEKAGAGLELSSVGRFWNKLADNVRDCE